MKLSEKIQLLRKENSYSQEELAAICNVSRQSISKWERVIVIFRTRIFDLSGKGITPIHGKMLDISHAEDKENWNELISYAKKLGVPNSQCDFLPEDFSKRTY